MEIKIEIVDNIFNRYDVGNIVFLFEGDDNNVTVSNKETGVKYELENVLDDSEFVFIKAYLNFESDIADFSQHASVLSQIQYETNVVFGSNLKYSVGLILNPKDVNFNGNETLDKSDVINVCRIITELFVNVAATLQQPIL